MLRKTAMLWAVFMCVASCTHAPFTQLLKETHRLGADELTRIQYYLSDTVTMTQEVGDIAANVTENHGIEVLEETNLEKIVIKGRTPGVAVKVGPQTLAVSFEPDRYIYFGVAGEVSGPEGAYVLLSQKRAEKHYFGAAGFYYWEWRMKYGNKRYRATADSFPVYLKIKLNSVSRSGKQTRIVEGVTVE